MSLRFGQHAIDRILSSDLPSFYRSSHSILAQLGLDSEDLPAEIWEGITPGKIVKGILAIALAYGLFRGIDYGHNWAVENVPSQFRQLLRQSIPLTKAVILVAITFYVINLFIKLSPNNILALTGTLAVALGFAFKDYVSSIIAGVVALFETPYRMGDRIQIGEHYGEVIDFGLRGIRLQTLDDNVVTIPHSQIWTKAVVNSNNGALEAQVVTDFYFGHTVDVEVVTRILYQAAYTSKYTQLNLPVMVRLELKSWGIHFKLKCYPIDIQDETAHETDLIRRAQQAFATHQLPYPVVATQDQASASPRSGLTAAE